ncbi:hypothetical protein RJ639_038638 [Escallonia herrerae]|uniref:Protein-tyrosine-phosphatase MKP1 n=1 Tax=Escallonia herrerae TaxID=1293975 RepID=A0AA88WJ93_9ASTE|nr:hypothetical protein RJ639_038638 [Escallonia herrerae]
MLGKEDGCQLGGSRKTYWRSASWSSSRTMLPPLNPDSEKDGADPNGNNNGGHRRFPVPLTPRSHSKARSCLPPLQPLSIARRSLDEWPKAGSDDVGEWPLPFTPSGRDVNNSGERLTLDLSSIQRNPDKNGGLVKREKIAFFDKECSKVAEHIYLGGDVVARDRDILKHHGITHILNCVGFVCPEYFKADFVYRTLWLQDNPSEDITSILYDVFDYFEDVREQRGRVFVHCCQGVSRSTSLVIAYLMWREGQSFDDAFQYVKAARGIADPNMGFACQLLQCQKRVHAFPLSPSSLLMMYRLAPHSPYDPLHLVPKMFNAPSPAALDSRGAFIIHIPSAIYVWIGKRCEAIMERDARGAVCQIVRYEKVQGPIVVIKEGEEPSYFWDAFSDLLPMMDKSSNGTDAVDLSIKILPGERTVESYNVDFEIFLKAIAGGFVPPFASETDHETHLPARESRWSALRRKFAPGSMKEFVSASKVPRSRVYPDSMLMVGVNSSVSKPLLFSASALSSSSSSSPSAMTSSFSSCSSASPPYLSPDSTSSDSSISSKCFSDSPTMSPSTSSCTHPVSSTLSSFSGLSLLPSKLSPRSISKTSEFIDVNFTSKPHSQLVSSPSKKSPLSIAERRGSMPKCLKLPMVTDGSSGKEALPRFLTHEQDGVRINDSSCSLYEDKTDNNLVSKEEGESFLDFMLQDSSGRVASANFSEEASFDKTSDKPWIDISSEGKGSTGLSGMLSCSSSCPNLKQPFVCRWPSLEKIETFAADDLDSRAVLIFVFPSSALEKFEYKVLYFWVGRAFSYDNSKAHIDANNEHEPEEINWNEVSSDVITQMGLPEDTRFKEAALQILKGDSPGCTVPVTPP